MITQTHIGVSGAGGGGAGFAGSGLSHEAEHRTPLTRCRLGSLDTPEVVYTLHRCANGGQLVFR